MLRHPLHRIDRRVICRTDFKVQVRPCGPSFIAHRTDHLSGRHGVAFLHQHVTGTLMGISRVVHGAVREAVLNTHVGS